FRMRLFAVLAVTIVVCFAASKKEDFDKKVTKLVTTYLGNNLPTATDMVATLLTEQKSFEDIATHLMKNVMTLVPATKYISALGMLTTFQSCIKGTGTKLEEGMAKLGGAFKKVLNGPYNKIIKKMKEMKKKKQPTANMKNQVYTIATAALTKKLVQQIINESKKVSTEPQYNCALGPLNTVMLTNLYDMKYAKAKKSG
ncbi:hypothetical protein PFISCL1PPCAC_8423, partial [Pristionchus fissidentatus]